MEAGTALVKELASGKQTEMKLDDLLQGLGY
jgi:hypothetical protein